MPASYYNGQEIKTTSKISGFSLVGKSSIKLAGRIITLSTDPPPPTLQTVVLYNTGARDPMTACSIGSGSDMLILYSTFPYAQEGEFLFGDSSGTMVFDGKDAWYFDEQAGAVVQVDSNGLIGPPFRC